MRSQRRPIAWRVLVLLLLGLGGFLSAGWGCQTSPGSGVEIRSADDAALAIDQLANAIEGGDRDTAIRLIAKKHKPSSQESLEYTVYTRDRRTVQVLRSRRYIGATRSYYVFVVTDPADPSATEELRVYRRNPDDGIYEDEGVEFF